MTIKHETIFCDGKGCEKKEPCYKAFSRPPSQGGSGWLMQGPRGEMHFCSIECCDSAKTKQDIRMAEAIKQTAERAAKRIKEGPFSIRKATNAIDFNTWKRRKR